MKEKLESYRLLPGGDDLLIEDLRILYNGAIQFLATHPIKENTIEEQLAWWGSLDHSKVMIHLYYLPGVTEPVAFSMLTDRGTHYSPMFAIDPKYWGRGLGEVIIKDYLRLAAGKPLRGEQLVSNGAICHLNSRLGWRVVAEHSGTQFLIHPNDVRDQEILDEIMRYQDEGAHDI